MYQQNSHPIWHKIEDAAYFYSVHSYYIEVHESNIITGISKYGIDFPSAIAKNNIFAVQFHPEKSQKSGLTLLKNFINWN